MEGSDRESSDSEDATKEYPTEYFEAIVETLKSVRRPGNFAAGGRLDFGNPVLTVSGLSEPFGLPICQYQAKQLVNQCSRAPFGRGEETIVDTDVRCTWQLDPKQFSIRNPEWCGKLDELLVNLKTDLGCSDTQDIACELYKLLLYEPGGFFKVSINVWSLRLENSTHLLEFCLVLIIERKLLPVKPIYWCHGIFHPPPPPFFISLG